MKNHDPGSGLQPRNSGLKGPHTYAQLFLTSSGTWPTSLPHQEKTCEDITPYGGKPQFPKNGRLFTPKYRFITPSTFDHTEKKLFTPSIFKITPSWFCSHHEDVDHTLENFVHTIYILFTPSILQIHTVIILFTPSTCCSHSWNFCSHHLNFVHTIYFQSHTGTILLFCSHHQDFIHTLEILGHTI